MIVMIGDFSAISTIKMAVIAIAIDVVVVDLVVFVTHGTMARKARIAMS